MEACCYTYSFSFKWPFSMEVLPACEPFAGGYQGHTHTCAWTVISLSLPRGAAVMAAGPSIATRVSVLRSQTFPGVSEPAFLLQTAQSIGSASGSPGMTRRCGAVPVTPVQRAQCASPRRRRDCCKHKTRSPCAGSVFAPTVGVPGNRWRSLTAIAGLQKDEGNVPRLQVPSRQNVPLEEVGVCLGEHGRVSLHDRGRI